MIKKNILATTTLLLTLALQSKDCLLHNHLLKSIDSAGFFDRAIIDIINVRKKIKNFVQGKHNWHGIKVCFATINNQPIETIVRRTEAFCGATFIVLPPSYPNIMKYVTSEHKDTVTKYIKTVLQGSVHHRQEHANYEGCFTGSYAIHPLTQKQMPIYVADYAIELFETRSNFAHVGIPAHHSRDFEFAQKHHLEIKLVITGQPHVPARAMPMFREGKYLATAYTKEDDDIIVVNSGLYNGDVPVAKKAIIAALQDLKVGSEYTCAIMYELYNKKYTLENLKTIEETMQRENPNAFAQHQETFAVLMRYVQADLLDIFEQFLIHIQAAKDLMVELINEHCQARQTTKSYLLTWGKLSNTESERVTFRRDILNFQDLVRFCNDLVNFLGDFASSCPHALDYLKRLKNSHE